MKKGLVSILLVMAMTLSSAAPVLSAEETEFSDVMMAESETVFTDSAEENTEVVDESLAEDGGTLETASKDISDSEIEKDLNAVEAESEPVDEIADEDINVAGDGDISGAENGEIHDAEDENSEQEVIAETDTIETTGENLMDASASTETFVSDGGTFAETAAQLDEGMLSDMIASAKHAIYIQDSGFLQQCMDKISEYEEALDFLYMEYEGLTEEEKASPANLAAKEKIDRLGESLKVFTEAISGMRVSASEAGSREMIAAEQKAWNLINTYADPQYFLTDPYRDELTDAQYNELQTAARNAVAGVDTTYEKIRAISAFVADRIYYDYLYYNNRDQADPPQVYLNPYDVFINQRTVCAGYSNLMRTLLISIGIPCMYMRADNHAYNVAYDAEKGRWIFSDTTWASRNVYTEEGKTIYGGYSGEYFDLTPEEIAKYSSHEVYGIEGMVDGSSTSAYYSMSYEGEWTDCNWYLEIIDNKSAEAVAVSEVGGLSVRDIKYAAFYQDTDLKFIDLSATQISEIANSAFQECNTLETVIFPASLESIGEYSFYECQGLKSVDLSQTKIKALPDYTFAKCYSLETVVFPVTLESIGKQLFYDCQSLKSADLSQTKIKELPDFTFYQCVSLVQLILPPTITELKRNTISSCSSLKLVDLSKTKIKTLEKFVFYNLTSLKKVKLPKTLTGIPYAAFCGCTSLETIDMSKTKVKQIGDFAFNDCKKLKSVAFSNSLTTIGIQAFMGDSRLTVVNLFRTKVKKIGKYAFYECDKLNTVKLPSTLQSISAGAFNCSNGVRNVTTVVVTKLSWKKLSYAGVNPQPWKGRKVYIAKKNSSGNLCLYQSGAVAKKLSGLIKYGDVLYYIKNGVQNKNYTGLAKYGKKLYYVKKGIHSTTYTGTVKYKGKLYSVKKGIAKAK